MDFSDETMSVNISERKDWKPLQRSACLTKCQTMALKAKREDDKDKNACLTNKPSGKEFLLYLLQF